MLIADHRVYPEEAVATAALRVQTWGNAHRLSSRAVLDTLGPVGPVVITGSPTQWPLPAPAAQ
ncbi:hypothetical protein AB0O31_03335 [Kitasatospora cineracea]|uniref:hypothetical protein n=1 Tax=Kitasatospora cineracea TaxID=88074 RepID=UPI0034288452